MCRGGVDDNASICINTQYSIYKQSKGPFMIGVPKKEKKMIQELFRATFYKLHLHETNLSEKN
jgi:hypothetical protein